jgi:hypothetical protein
VGVGRGKVRRPAKTDQNKIDGFAARKALAAALMIDSQSEVSF